MKLANYTTGVSESRTIAEIESMLAQAGARSIHKEYGASAMVSALTFTIANGTGRDMAIRLPADAQAVRTVLESGVKRPRSGTATRIEQQAGRVAWRIMRDWLRVQLSLIQMHQAEPMQVFLPYLWDPQRHESFYQLLKASGFKALPAARE